MSLQEYYQSFADGLQASANVKTLFGEPIKAEPKTPNTRPPRKKRPKKQ